MHRRRACLGPGPVLLPGLRQRPSGVHGGRSGELLAWTDRPGKGLYGLVKLDGAASAVLHRLLCSPAEAVIGSRFRARFAGERRGHILDIEGFAPEDKP